MDVNFELYKVFYYVAKELSFSAAAARLYISQSAVSQSVSTLEKKMQCRLFVRNTKQVKLSPEGEILYKHVEQAFNFIKAGERGITEIHTLNKGEVRIGASDTICKYYLLPYFEKFHKAFPQVKIHVTNRTSPKCLELLKNGTVDIVVVNMPNLGGSQNLAVKKIKTVQDVFIAGRNFTDLQGRAVSINELANYPLLMLEKNAATRAFIDSFLAARRVSITPEIELESVDLLIEMAKIGLGISFVGEDFVKEELARKEIFILEIKEKIPSRSLGVVTNKNVPLTAAAQKFIALFE
ncbi:MAG: LysR substrate-binding domain-containing protein [Thermincola sp.]|jgi:DNA-binding transcriptional LysR family regulator|nr:LysR substrate-binding domain-containing protein [Thermincola sp.]MDT3704477.1 LysR substrate-binding domain-containing protein [Thermincola sp.]